MIEKYIPHSVMSKLKNYDRVVVGGLIKAGHDSKILFFEAFRRRVHAKCMGNSFWWHGV